MLECYAMQLLETKGKNTKTKEQRTMVTKGKNNEAQGPCRKDSVRLSLLHPKILDAPRALEFVFTLE